MKMRWHQKLKLNILDILLLTFLFSIDFSYGKKPIWKPGNENERKFPIDRTLQSERRIPTVSKTQISAIQQNDRKIPIDSTLHNNRKTQNEGRIPTERISEYDRRIPIDRTLQNIRKNPFNRPNPLQNDRKIPIERTLQNGRRIPIDRILQNFEGIPIDKTLQNDRIKNKNKKIDTILEEDRKMHNNLKAKIDRLLENENLQTDKTLRGGRSMINSRRMQNGGIEKLDNTQQNLKQILDERQQKMTLARRMWAATSHPILRQKNVTTTIRTTTRRNIPAEAWNLPLLPPFDEQKPKDEWQEGRWGDLSKSTMLMMNAITRKEVKGTDELKIRACYCIATTYISALQDFQKYYTLRIFYRNSLEFEIGYLVSEIISKYQRMLELFNRSTSYFYDFQMRERMPSMYMLYMYTNVLEMGKVIAHLCNMLTEIEEKYKFKPVSGGIMGDYHLPLMDKGKIEQEAAIAKEAAAYERVLQRIKDRKHKKIQKVRAKDLNFDSKPSSVIRKPQHRSWPLVYGWSIEYYW